MKYKYKIGNSVAITLGEHKGKVVKITACSTDGKYRTTIDGAEFSEDALLRVYTRYEVGDRVTLPAMTITSIEADHGGTVLYRLEGVDGAFPTESLFPAWRGEALSIYRKGRETIAKRFDEHGNTAATSVAYCSDEDSYDLLTGAKVAIERMEEEAALPDDLRELLTPGTIGQAMDGKYFVAAGSNVVYEAGGYDFIESLNANNLMWRDKHGIKVLYDETISCFLDARNIGKNYIKWRRRGI